MFKSFRKNPQKRKKLKTKIHLVYTFLASVIVLGFAFFYTSKIFIADNADILNSEIGVEYSINGNGKFTINEWLYDESSNKMQVTLITSNLTDYLSDLKFISVAKSNLNKELPTKIVYNTRDIYIVMIDDVPDDFEQVVLRLVKEEVDFDYILSIDNKKLSDKEQKEIEENILANIYADQRVIKTGEVKQQKVKEYVFKVTNEMIKNAEKDREVLMNEIKKNTLLISRIKEEIELLKQELIYQTIEEQDLTNNQIFTFEKQIEDYERGNSEILVDIDSIDSKIERLVQRKRDLKF